MNRSWDQRLIALVLVALVIAAAGIRWLYLHQISPYFDEFTSLWAAKTVLQRGLPLFPSGNFYTHGLLFTYLEAPFLWALGLREPLLRLPSLLIGVGTVVAAFLMGRRLLGPAAGLVAAAAVAMDPEAIAWGGRVRMYALLQLLVLLAVYFFYQGAIVKDRPGKRWLALVLLVAAILTHVEAALLLPALVVAVLAFRGLRWSLRPSVVGPFLLGAGSFLLAVFGLNLGEASHLEAINEVRPYLALPSSNLLSGLRSFAPAFLDPWRLPFTLLVLAGVVSLLRRGRQSSPEDSSLRYLYLVLAVTLGLLFFLAGPTWQTPRYAFMLLPLLWLLAGGVLVKLLARAPARWSAVAAVVLAVFVGVVGYRTAFTQEWGYDRAFRALQEAWQPGDVVLTTNPAACALYLEQCGYYALQYGYEEYVMPGPNGKLVDRWVALPLLNSVEQLRQVLSSARRVWFVTDGWRLQSRFENEFIRLVLDQMRPVFTERGMAVFQGQGYEPHPSPAVSWPVTASFGNELALDGVDLSAAHLQPGDELEVSLRWKALEAPRTAYTVFLHLIGPDGQRIAQQDELLLNGFYQPTVWPQDEVVVDRHRLTLPADLAPGRYRLETGLYPPDSANGATTPPESPDRVVLGYLTSAGLPVSSPQTPLDADFGGQVRLLGYSQACDLGSPCTVTLFWQAPKKVDADYTVFVHLVDADGRILAQHDGMPDGGFYPTSAWQPGEVVEDKHRLDLPADLPPGEYRLVTGLYRLDASGSQRLPVSGSDGQPGADHIVLPSTPLVGGDQSP